jgi:hypothetical protein
MSVRIAVEMTGTPHRLSIHFEQKRKRGYEGQDAFSKLQDSFWSSASSIELRALSELPSVSSHRNPSEESRRAPELSYNTDPARNAQPLRPITLGVDRYASSGPSFRYPSQGVSSPLKPFTKPASLLMLEPSKSEPHLWISTQKVMPVGKGNVDITIQGSKQAWQPETSAQ